MRHQSMLKCALMGAVGCGFASAAFAIQNTQPMKGHPDWGYTIYGLPGEGSNKQTAYVFTNQNAALSWKAPSDVSSVRLLVVGGGGAGGGRYDTSTKDGGFGGGGGGGFTEVDAVDVVPGETYAIVVGKGGAATTSKSENGGQSSFVGQLVEARADGGGYGGGYKQNGAKGANGGGGGFNFTSGTTFPQTLGGSADGYGKGYAGGKSGGNGTTRRSGGGGGGAIKEGGTPTTNKGGAGGDGKMSDITGAGITYAGGGGGGGHNQAGGGAGGQGGGGYGGDTGGATKIGTAGTDGLGGGGGGSALNGKCAGGPGGSGVVIVRCNESKEDPNPMPFDRDPMDNNWTGLGADANWSTDANWQSPLLYIDTAVFPAGCTAAVTMDKTTDAEYPAAALLSIGANANVTLDGSTVNTFAGDKAMKLMGDGATLTVTGAGNSVAVQNKGAYTLGDNVTVRVTGGANFDVADGSLDLRGAQGLKFVAEGVGSRFDIRPLDPAEHVDVTFEARNGGTAAPQGYVTGADSKVTVITDGGDFSANFIDIGGAIVHLVAGDGTTFAIGALDVAAGSTINVTNAAMTIYSNGNPTRLGVDGAVTMELVGANPTFEKLYHKGPGTVAFGDGLTVKLRPEATWAAGARFFSTRPAGDSAWTVSSGVHYEIDCSALAPKQELTFRLYELNNSNGSVAVPAAGNVKLTGKNADKFDVSFALSADGKNLDCTLKPKKFGFIFSIR